MRAGWLVLCAFAAACAGSGDDGGAPEPAPAVRRVIVGLRAPQIRVAQLGLQARMLPYRAEQLHAFATLPYVVMRVDDEALARLQADPGVTSVREDRVVPPLLDSSTAAIHAPQAWAQGATGAGQVIAVIDTGVRSDHVNLAGKVISEACFSTTDAGFGSLSLCAGGVPALAGTGTGFSCDLSVNGCEHGTHVANIAAGLDTIYSGVAKGANLVAIMAASRFDDTTNCRGAPPCALFYDSDWISGLEHVLTLKQGGMPIAAVNMSLGGGEFADHASCDAVEPAAVTAIANLKAAGVATIIASGNDGHTAGLAYPACLTGAISVGATTDADVVASFSNSASYLDLMAPGVQITAAVPTTTTSLATFSGTSMAAPHATGTYTVVKAARPSLTVDQIVALLKTSGTPVFDARNGRTFPRVDVAAAVNAAGIEPPVASPGPGSYAPPLDVTLTTPTPGATIRYTLDGSAPAATSTAYTGPIALPASAVATVRAAAFKNGQQSLAISASYDVGGTVAAPVLSPVPGTYPTAQLVALSTTTPGATIRFSTDGSAVTAASPVYAAPIALGLQTTTTIRARAFRAFWLDSPQVSGTFDITDTVATPTATPPAGSYATAQTVALATTTPGATIRFTTDGTPATATSPIYAAPIAVPAGVTMTIRARALRSGWADSAELVAAYEVFGTVATPVLSPAPGTFTTPQSVTITTSTAGATIRYTTDGSPVTGSSPVYAGPISIGPETSVMVRAAAFRTNWMASAEAAGSYAVTCAPAAPTVALAPPTQSAGPGAAVTFDATITNRDAAGCLPAMFALAHASPIGWTASLGASTTTLAPGQSTQVALSVTSAASALAGDNPVTVTASNARSGTGSGSATYAVTCTRAAPSIAIAPQTQSGQVGEALVYTVTVANHDVGCAPSAVTLASTVDLGWSASYDMTAPSVPSGGTATANLTVTPPAGTALGSHPVVASVTRPESTGALASASYVVAPSCARAMPTLVLSPATQSAVRGATLTYTATLTNNDSACGSQAFALSLDVPAGWIGSAPAVSVPSGATVMRAIDITSPNNAPAGSVIVTLHASAPQSGAASTTATYTVQTQCVRRPPALSVVQPAALTSPAAAHYAVHVTNTDHVDCGPTSFTLAAAVPAGWTAPSASSTIAPGASADVDLTVTPPTTLGASSTTFDLTASSAAGHAASAQGIYVLGCERGAPALAVTELAPNERYRVALTSHDTAVCATGTFRVREESDLALTPAQADIAVGPGMEGAVEVAVGPGATPGDHEVHVIVTRLGEAAPLADQTIVVTIAKPDGDGGGCSATRGPASLSLALLGLLIAVRRRRLRG